jgi:membrane-bound lytic murein transglycosylase A
LSRPGAPWRTLFLTLFPALFLALFLTPVLLPLAHATGAAAPGASAEAAAADPELHSIEPARLRSAFEAWAAACPQMLRLPAAQAARWRAACGDATALRAAQGSDAAVLAFLARHFKSAQSRPVAALLTGYYTPRFAARAQPAPGFAAPVYRLPAPAPSASRAQLARNGTLAGQELAWLADPLDAFSLEVQGSGELALPDGSVWELAYAGSNGQPYVSIGAVLVARGALSREAATFPGIRAWAAAHPADLAALLEENPRQIFFRVAATGGPAAGDPELGARGSLGVPLTPGISVAADPAIYPPGTLLVARVETPQVSPAGWQLWVVQDRGSALKGAGRLDLYQGRGTLAGERAGRQRERATVMALLPPLQAIGP